MELFNDIEVDVVVVGAGITGLVTAFGILKKDPNLDVIVLEAKNGIDEIGATSALLQTSNGQRKHFFFGRPRLYNKNHENVTWLVDQLQIPTSSAEIYGTNIALNTKGKLERFFETIPHFIEKDLKPFFQAIEILGTNVPTWDPWLFPYAKFAERKSIETIIQNTLPMQDVTRQWARTIVREILGQEAHEVSILSFGAFLNACGGWQKAIENNIEENSYTIKGGLIKIEEMLLDFLTENNVLFNERITYINNFGRYVEMISSSGRLYRCRQAVLAISPKEILQIVFEPNPLPEKLQMTLETLNKMPIPFNTYWLASFYRPFWRASGDSGHVVVNVDSMQMEFRGAWDASNENSSALGGLVRCNGCIKEKFERRQDVLEALATIWGSDALLPLDYAEVSFENLLTMMSVTRAPGCGIGQGGGELLRTPWDKVIFAVALTASCWPGYLDGDIQVGRRSAIEVLYVLRPQTLSFHDFTIISPPSYRKKRRRVEIEDDSAIINKRNIILATGLGAVIIFIIYYYKIK